MNTYGKTIGEFRMVEISASRYSFDELWFLIDFLVGCRPYRIKEKFHLCVNMSHSWKLWNLDKQICSRGVLSMLEMVGFEVLLMHIRHGVALSGWMLWRKRVWKILFLAFQLRIQITFHLKNWESNHATWSSTIGVLTMFLLAETRSFPS